MATVLITGANRGLGLELAKMFRAQGDFVIAHSRKDEPPVSSLSVIGDLTHKSTIDALAESCERHDVDILINNAGVLGTPAFFGLKFKDLEAAFGPNLFAPIMLTSKIWPIFSRKKSGMVVNINSIAGKDGNDSVLYAASKAGLRGFSQSLQFEATKIGVRVLNVTLGGMKTGMTAHRADYDKLMEPHEVAVEIAALCTATSLPSLRVTEIEMMRRKY